MLFGFVGSRIAKTAHRTRRLTCSPLDLIFVFSDERWRAWGLVPNQVAWLPIHCKII